MILPWCAPADIEAASTRAQKTITWFFNGLSRVVAKILKNLAISVPARVDLSTRKPASQGFSIGYPFRPSVILPSRTPADIEDGHHHDHNEHDDGLAAFPARKQAQQRIHSRMNRPVRLILLCHKFGF
ncbi:hypothetical protein [Azospirillum soli]|uniref:hypothetical protein n=1 Tax=Azospirillum soli TaxID=1304799 RepID=UPI001AE21BFB|nr:hypothetical protein [Azospirillum soli]MBP2316855.1 hypothetical protein [Azospirillum soli]